MWTKKFRFPRYIWHFLTLVTSCIKGSLLCCQLPPIYLIIFNPNLNFCLFIRAFNLFRLYYHVKCLNFDLNFFFPFNFCSNLMYIPLSAFLYCYYYFFLTFSFSFHQKYSQPPLGTPILPSKHTPSPLPLSTRWNLKYMQSV